MLTNKLVTVLLAFFILLTVSCHAYNQTDQMYYHQKDIIAFGLQVQYQVVKLYHHSIVSLSQLIY